MTHDWVAVYRDIQHGHGQRMVINVGSCLRCGSRKKRHPVPSVERSPSLSSMRPPPFIDLIPAVRRSSAKISRASSIW